MVRGWGSNKGIIALKLDLADFVIVESIFVSSFSGIPRKILFVYDMGCRISLFTRSLVDLYAKLSALLK